MAGKHGGSRKGAGRKSNANRPPPRGQICLSFAGPPVAHPHRTALTVQESRLQLEATERAEQQLRADQVRQNDLADNQRVERNEERHRQRTQQDAINVRRLERYTCLISSATLPFPPNMAAVCCRGCHQPDLILPKLQQPQMLLNQALQAQNSLRWLTRTQSNTIMTASGASISPQCSHTTNRRHHRHRNHCNRLNISPSLQ